MTKLPGRRAHFSITDVGGTSRDISAFCSNLDMPRSADSYDVTSFGQADKTNIGGPRGATMRAQGFWDNTGTTGPDDVLGNLLGQGAAGTVVTTFIYGPSGSAGGDIKYTGSCLLTSFNVTSPVAGAVSFTADFQITGSVQRTTF